jgi:hypothetical protein
VRIFAPPDDATAIRDIAGLDGILLEASDG